MPVPYVRVEVGFASAPDDPAQQWTDISEHVQLAQGLTWSRGRSDEFAAAEPGRLSCVLDNTAGRFTAGLVTGPYHPNVKPRKRIRVSTSADGVTWSQRWDGYVDGWPASWVNGIAEVPRVSIGATDRLLRLTKVRTLRDPLIEELGDAAPDQVDGARFDLALFQ